MHKPLLIPVEGQTASNGLIKTEDLDDRVFRFAELMDNASVLDAGCGFGATLFKWQQKKEGNYSGYTNSRYQLKIACGIAQRRGTDKQCRFYLRNFEDKITEKFDAIIAIEALLHATNFETVFRNLSQALNPGGRLVVVDDMPYYQMTSQNRFYRILENTWVLPRMRPVDDFLQIISGLGLKLVAHQDLTAYVRLETSEKIESRLKILKMICKFLPFPSIRLYLNTHRGGYALQKLYREGAMGYHLIVARKVS
jgi:cyclopropane fatty-acyl-phospholipid synthase-like methyltransferase